MGGFKATPHCDDDLPEAARFCALIDWDVVEKRAARRAKTKLPPLSPAHREALAAALLAHADRAAGLSVDGRRRAPSSVVNIAACPVAEEFRALVARLADLVAATRTAGPASLAAIAALQKEVERLAASRSDTLARGLSDMQGRGQEARAGIEPFFQQAAAALEASLPALTARSPALSRFSALIWEAWGDAAEILLHLSAPSDYFADTRAFRAALATWAEKQRY